VVLAVGGFLRSSAKLLSKRIKLLVALNLAFFSVVLVTAMVAQFALPPVLYSGWSFGVPEIFLWNGFLMAAGIFLFNIAASSFLFVTLPGMFFFHCQWQLSCTEPLCGVS
jgi:hypothetical protein